MLENVKSVTDYLNLFGKELAAKVQQKAQPLFYPGDPWEKKMDTLLRRPFPAQGDAIMALANALKDKRSAMIIAECGVGKTLIALASTYISTNGGRPPRVLMMVPGHLVRKSVSEVHKTIPGASAKIIRKLKDVQAIDTSARNKEPEYYIISKDKAKLGYAWKPAVVMSRMKGGYCCPSCGKLIIDNDGMPVDISYLKRKKQSCMRCASPLWTADNSKMRRFAVSEFVKKHMSGFFDFFIADEVHELKGGSTAQGNSFGALASASGKTLALTGTLLGGYGDDIFYILYRLSPGTMKKEGLEYHRISEWMSRYGVLEKITKYDSEDNSCSKGKKISSVMKRRPGISPMVLSNHLLGKCAFIHLSDIALDLPEISEQVVSIAMEPELEAAYMKLEHQLAKAMKEALVMGSKRLLGAYLNNLLSYPDKPFGNSPIIDPLTKGLPPEKQKVIAVPAELSREKTYAKERQLAELVKAEARQGRKCFVFAQYTGTKDITPRLKETLEREGLKVEILRSSVKPELREEWVKDKVAAGLDAIIANPKLVETGLDLLDFPTLIFHQTGYSVYTLRQASRRSWRIGQDRDVKVYYLFYEGTLQEKALQLMGSKMEASLAIEGKFSEEGLLAMTQGEDMSTALAKALLDGLDIEGAEDIWRKINEKNAVAGKDESGGLPEEAEAPDAPESPAADSTDAGDAVDEDSPSTLCPPEQEPGKDSVVFVNFTRFIGDGKRKRKRTEKKAVTKEELDEILAKEEGQAQFMLFG
jgi:superfamily II DNA or RNA helicase